MAWKVRGRGRIRRKVPGEMNRLEAKYAQHLGLLKNAGGVLWYAYETLTFKLAFDTRFTPDFAVMTATGEIEFHEVKGGLFRDDAKVKLKVAAAMFPFRFLLVQAIPERDGGGWRTSEV